jgi:5-methylcytosine-specific restriction endonuclease McrA
MDNNCKNCGKSFDLLDKKKAKYMKGRIYCSLKCQHEDQYKQNISDWLSKKITGKKADGRPSDFVRKYLLEETNYKCSSCGWGKPNPVNGIIYLEVDHIDGSRENGYRENLRVLCPNCHTLTDTYKTLNKNIGYHKERKQRKNQI